MPLQLQNSKEMQWKCNGNAKEFLSQLDQVILPSTVRYSNYMEPACIY